MPITFVGPVCARPGCPCPTWKDQLCARCWRFARLFSKDVEMFAYQPLNGYRDDRDAVELPWELWELEADARGVGLAELFAEAPAVQRFEPRHDGEAQSHTHVHEGGLEGRHEHGH